MEVILYLSNGYPTLDSSFNTAIEYADAGCRMMEIDFPSRDPYLDVYKRQHIWRLLESPCFLY